MFVIRLGGLTLLSLGAFYQGRKDVVFSWHGGNSKRGMDMGPIQGRKSFILKRGRGNSLQLCIGTRGTFVLWPYLFKASNCMC